MIYPNSNVLCIILNVAYIPLFFVSGGGCKSYDMQPGLSDNACIVCYEIEIEVRRCPHLIPFHTRAC